MLNKQGLKEFQKVYDIVDGMCWMALDLAQDLRFRFEVAKDKTVQDNDVRAAYDLISMGEKPSAIEALQELAETLGYTREDYIKDTVNG